MNPNVNFQTIQRENSSTSPDPAYKNSHEVPLVPPRRVLSRFIVPVFLLSTFTGIAVYALKDTFHTKVDVAIFQPVSVATGAGNDDLQTTSTAKTQMPDETVLFQAPGWVEPAPSETIISSLVTGTVTNILVREGDKVSSSQTVALLDDTDARTQFKKSEAVLAVAQAELSAATDNYNNPISLQENLRISVAEKNRLVAEKSRAERQFRYSEKLAKISGQLGLTGADSRLSSEKAEVESIVSLAELNEVSAKLESQQAKIDSLTSQTKLRLEDKARLELAHAKMDEAKADIESSRIALERCRIQSPTTGTILKIMAAPGNLLTKESINGTHIASLYDPEHLQIRAEVPLAESHKIRENLRVEIESDAYPAKKISGLLNRIVHEADIQRNSLPVKVTIISPPQEIKPGMVCRLKFFNNPTDATDDQNPRNNVSQAVREVTGTTGQVIPENAVFNKKDSTGKVWVVTPAGQARSVPIDFQPAQDNAYIIALRGISQTDKVILPPYDRIQENTKVNILSNQNQEGLFHD